MDKEIYDPIESANIACCDYKSALFGMIRLDKTDEQKEKYLSAAMKYKRALKSAIKYLRDDLKNLEEEMRYYDH